MSEDGPTMKAPHRSPKTNTEEAVGMYHSLLQTKFHCEFKKCVFRPRICGFFYSFNTCNIRKLKRAFYNEHCEPLNSNSHEDASALLNFYCSHADVLDKLLDH